LGRWAYFVSGSLDINAKTGPSRDGRVKPIGLSLLSLFSRKEKICHVLSRIGLPDAVKTAAEVKELRHFLN
jgi:hypothetical protein